SRHVLATSAIAAHIIWRGTGLIAGSPGGTGSPGSVTVPTPGPALNLTPLPVIPFRIVASTSAPWVTSGSSPASLITPAVAVLPPIRVTARANATSWPPGSVIWTGSGNSPVSSAAYADLVAAAAQAPVVQPRRKWRVSSMENAIELCRMRSYPALRQASRRRRDAAETEGDCRRRASLGCRQDHGDARAAFGLPAPWTARARCQMRP